MARKCKTCRYWNGEGFINNLGECRRYAPQRGSSGDGLSLFFGFTGSDEWCGDWEATDEAIHESVKRQVEELERPQ